MIMKIATKLLIAFLAAVIATPVLAGSGAGDKLDPCIEQVDKFQEERSSYLQQLDKEVIDADTAAVTPKYREAWMKAKRFQLRESFDTFVAPMLKDAGVPNIDAAYDPWFDKQLENIGAANVDKLVAVSFHQELKKLRIKQRASGEDEIASEKEKLDKSCKMDFGNQALRVVLTAALAPINRDLRNLDLAKRESGVGGKIIAATTGISIDAINKNGGVFGGGLSGGENSFFRKNLGIRF
jgi:hypothetical protein